MRRMVAVESGQRMSEGQIPSEMDRLTKLNPNTARHATACTTNPADAWKSESIVSQMKLCGQTSARR